jgi:hypothetical protein
MKTILTILLSLCIGTGFAQKSKSMVVPDAVKKQFSTMYPSVTKVDWEKEGEYYEAEFDNNKVETSVVFDASGKHIETEVEIAVTDLPQSVRDYVTKNLNNAKINEASKITAVDGTVTYEAEVGNTDYIFDSNGNLVKKESEEGDKDDDDDKK